MITCMHSAALTSRAPGIAIHVHSAQYSTVHNGTYTQTKYDTYVYSYKDSAIDALAMPASEGAFRLSESPTPVSVTVLTVSP